MTATQPPPPAPPAEIQATNPLTNPNLSSMLRLEYDTLVNDVRRAHELCAEFQKQLVGKSVEADEFKELFAKTQSDLFQLQDSITELREERHRLANEAMRAMALSRKLVEMTAERDGLLAEVETLKKRAAERAAEVKTPAPIVPATTDEPGVKVALAEMWRTLERLQTLLDCEVEANFPPRSVAPEPAKLSERPAPAGSSRS